MRESRQSSSGESFEDLDQTIIYLVRSFSHILKIFLCFSMENHNAKLVSAGGLKPNPSNDLSEQEENPTLNRCVEEEEEVTTELTEPPSPNAPQSSRTPFTNLSQVDADLALARTLQEQVLKLSLCHLNLFLYLFHNGSLSML